jgi:hypothetical protein
VRRSPHFETEKNTQIWTKTLNVQTLCTAFAAKFDRNALRIRRSARVTEFRHGRLRLWLQLWRRIRRFRRSSAAKSPEETASVAWKGINDLH